jgi:dTDP-4-amino-4,6-dideoxygalactose transaminase
VDGELVRTEVKVPFLDLRPTNDAVRQPILERIEQMIDSGAFTNGPEVEEFESAFAAYCGTRHCVGVSSGLDGLRLALLAGELEPGDEVVVPALTFAATVEAVLQSGCRPIVVDIGDDDYNIDVGAVRTALSDRTRAVIPVHLFGQLAALTALGDLTDSRGIAVIEDACQAHGASRDGIHAGSAGVAGVFSFYPAKNLGAFGDAGAVVTNSEAVARRIQALREHGQLRKYEHELEGYTARLDTLQAIVLLHKLQLLDHWNEERRAIARAYGEVLAGIGDLRLPHVPAGSDPVWHLYVIRTAAPEALATFLADRGIGSGRHYPQPVHLAPAYRDLGYADGSFPVAEAVARECLSLPIFPGMTDGQVARVTDAIEAYFSRG